jgi:hypothetical protein
MVKTIPAAKNESESPEFFANSAILSILCYIVLLTAMFLGSFWVILLVSLCVMVFSCVIIYSRLSVASAPACKGPLLCSFFVAYAMLTQPASMPFLLSLAIEVIIATLSLAYIVTKLDLLFILQVIMLCTPSMYAMDVTLHKGLLPVLSFIILFMGYIILARRMSFSFSMTHAYMITFPLFKTSYLGLISYMALCVMIHSMVAFRSTVIDHSSDEEDEETGSEPVPDPPAPVEPVKPAVAQPVTVPQQQTNFIPRPRLVSVAAPVSPANYEIPKLPLRSYASTPSHPVVVPVSNQTQLSKEEKTFGSIFMQHYGKS